jgi:hypothetical protein
MSNQSVIIADVGAEPRDWDDWLDVPAPNLWRRRSPSLRNRLWMLGFSRKQIEALPMTSPPKEPNPSPTQPPIPSDVPPLDEPTSIPQPGPDTVPAPDEPLPIPEGTPLDVPPGTN